MPTMETRTMVPWISDQIPIQWRNFCGIILICLKLISKSRYFIWKALSYTLWTLKHIKQMEKLPKNVIFNFSYEVILTKTNNVQFNSNFQSIVSINMQRDSY